MALTFTALGRKQPVGHRFEQLFEVTFDNSYPTGGEVYAVTDFLGFVQLEEGYPVIEEINAGGKIVENDRTNKKWLVKFFDYDAVADGGAIEVANASDQSTVKMTVRVRGR